jgi:membrane protein DedA with SNARE-associated domain
MSDNVTGMVAHWIVQTISATGYLGVSSLMALESACIPLPSEIIMPFAGYLVSIGRFNLFWVATAGALGCNIGSTVAYLIAARGGRAAVEKWGSLLLMGPHELQRVERYFEKYGSVTVFFGRLLPVVRTFIAVPAGLARMPQVKFQVYTFLGSWPWCFGLALVGEQLGEHWNKDPWLQSFLHEADLLIAAGLVLWATWWFWRRKIS